jgi:maleate cis-trans isomerase
MATPKKKELSVQKKDEEEKNGLQKCRRLAFISEMMKARNVIPSELADMMGITEPAINWILQVADDCSMTRAEQMTDLLGFNMKLRLKQKKKDEAREPSKKTTEEIRINSAHDSVPFNIRIKYTKPAEAETRRKPITSKLLDRMTPESRLWFLKEFIDETGTTLTEFLATCGMDYTSFKNMVIGDNMKISRVFGIAEKFEAAVDIEITEKED